MIFCRFTHFWGNGTAKLKNGYENAKNVFWENGYENAKKNFCENGYEKENAKTFFGDTDTKTYTLYSCFSKPWCSVTEVFW